MDEEIVPENQNVIRLSYIWARAVAPDVLFQDGDVDEAGEDAVGQNPDSAVGGAVAVEGVLILLT